MNSATDFIEKEVSSFCNSSYFDYSMYVILDRALPSIQDGLKPVQRRILYAMSELSLGHNSKYKKSARTIGDVIGKYHPHGDSACYEAMVLMSQDFSYRYPLVDGQGNWGSQDDPKSYAAMRYTESRLTAYSGLLLSDLTSGAVDFVSNFDQTLNEPVSFPVRVPNILLNGSIGIAVGMATEIPPHNLREVVSAVKIVLDNPLADVSEIMSVLPGPDYPTGGIIISTKENIKSIYETGRGSVVQRAEYHVEDDTNIVITALPYKVSGEKVIGTLGELMVAKKLAMVDDIRDESDHENSVRIVIMVNPSSSGDIESIMDYLYSETELQVSRKIQMNMLGLDGFPREKSIVEILSEWIVYRKQCLTKRFGARISKIESRIHLIDGLITCYLNLDEVIRIIREDDSPAATLKNRFGLSDDQVSYILDTRLRNLAKLEELELNKEKKNLIGEMSRLSKLISSDKKMSDWIKDDLDEIIAAFSDDRRCTIIESIAPAKKISFEVSDPVTVVISKNGWIRSGKGHQLNASALQYKVGDSYLMSLQTVSDAETIVQDSNGRFYVIQNSSLPNAKSLGNHISSMVSMESGSTVVDAFKASDKSNRFLLSSDGYGFKCAAEDLFTKQKKGKQVINCEKHMAMPSISILDSDTHVALFTNSDMLAIVSLSDFDFLKKGKGLKIIDLPDGDFIVRSITFSDTSALLFKGIAIDERLTFSKYSGFIVSRGRRPKKLPKSLIGFETLTAEVK